MGNKFNPALALTIARLNKNARVLIVVPAQAVVSEYMSLLKKRAEAEGFLRRLGAAMYCKEGSSVMITHARKGLLRELSGLSLTHVYLVGLWEEKYDHYYHAIIRAPEGRTFIPPMGLRHVPLSETD